MTIYFPGNFPNRILTRIRKQAAGCNQFQSCQSEITYLVPTANEIDVWNQGPPIRTTYILLTDTHQILPYTTLEFSWHIGATPPATAWHVPFSLSNGLSEAEVANYTVGQFALWKSVYSQQYPDLKSLNIGLTNSPGNPLLTFYMPWGMTGLTGVSYSGPDTDTAVRQGAPGVDHPILSGLWGPQRFALPVTPRYREDYYGSVPIG